MKEAKNELISLLEEPSLAQVPFLVLGNKSDLRSSLKPDQLSSSLGLPPSSINPSSSSDEGDGRPVKLFACSLVEGSGYEAAFEVFICYS